MEKALARPQERGRFPVFSSTPAPTHWQRAGGRGFFVLALALAPACASVSPDELELWGSRGTIEADGKLFEADTEALGVGLTWYLSQPRRCGPSFEVPIPCVEPLPAPVPEPTPEPEGEPESDIEAFLWVLGTLGTLCGGWFGRHRIKRVVRRKR